MANIKKITKFLDDYIEENNLSTLEAVEANRLLANAGLLTDSVSHPGKPLRDLLRKVKLPHAAQESNNRWEIPHSTKFIPGSIKTQIRDIALRLNDIAAEENSDFSKVQKKRVEKYDLQIEPKYNFTTRSIKETYAFHRGGRREIQFNFGLSQAPGKEVLRYGVAFSLETAQDVPDPVNIFTSKIQLFNEFVENNNSYFDGYLMWVHDKDSVYHIFNGVEKIPKRFIEEGNFIFIGKYFDKELSKINENDIRKILSTFEYLYRLYLYVEDSEKTDNIESKICRICWNTNGWVKPSGRVGKSNFRDSHEQKYGMGLEEWLLDLEKVLNGFHYSFLEPINKFYDTYVGQKFNMLFYTLDGTDKSKYWVGAIKNVNVIAEEEADKIYQIYKKNGWLDEREAQLQNFNIDVSKKRFWKYSLSHFNIKFKPGDIVELFDPMVPVRLNSKYVRSARYNLLNIESLDVVLTDELNTLSGFQFGQGSSNSKDLATKSTRTFTKEPIELPLNHNKLQKSFLEYLQDKYGKNNVEKESPTYGKKIDIVRQEGNRLLFYEIKTYNSLMHSLRVALGQLLEYCCYPNHKFADKLILVSDKEPDEEFGLYLNHLNSIVNIPLGYIHYDMDSKSILHEI